MTQAATEPEVDTTDDGDGDDGLDHYICECDHNTALCGTDVTDTPEVEPDSNPEKQCMVCEDLAETICPRCGFDPFN